VTAVAIPGPSSRPGPKPKPNIVRFLRLVRISDDDDGCWIWLGGKNANGYGSFKPYHRPTTLSHRFMFEHQHGQPIPEGLHLDHLCSNPSCVNPAHLEPVTPQENVARSVLRRRGGDPGSCVNGHELTLENTYEWRGLKLCRSCRRAQRSRRRA
jgi:hypothetical protein